MLIVRRICKICEKRLLASSCLSVRPFATTSLPLDGFSRNCMSIFLKSVENLQIWLKSDKNNGYVTWRPVVVYDNISLSSSRMRNVSGKVVEKIKTQHEDLLSFMIISRSVLLEWEIFQEKVVEKIKTQHEDLSSFMIISRSVLLEWEIFQDKIVEEIKTQLFPRKSYRLWDNVENIVEPARPHMTI